MGEPTMRFRADFPDAVAAREGSGMEKNAGREQAIVMYINTLGATAYRTR